MKETSKNIFENESLINIENYIEPVDEIFRLQNANQLTIDEDKYKNILNNKTNKTNKTNKINKTNKTNKTNKIIKYNNPFSGEKSYNYPFLKSKFHNITNDNFTELKRDFLSCDVF